MLSLLLVNELLDEHVDDDLELVNLLVLDILLTSILIFSSSNIILFSSFSILSCCNILSFSNSSSFILLSFILSKSSISDNRIVSSKFSIFILFLFFLVLLLNIS